AFESLLRDFEQKLARFSGQLSLPNGLDAVEALLQALVRPALNPELCAKYATVARSESVAERNEAFETTSNRKSTPPMHDIFDRPVIIVAAPRSGSTLLFETLAGSPDFFTVGGESHEVIEGIPALRPHSRGFSS